MKELLSELKMTRKILAQAKRVTLDSSEFLSCQSKIIDLDIDIDKLEAAIKVYEKYKGAK